ncbi:serine protease [Phenylobacterium hankyongense]|uniref:Serine protease n=1 Tax=Phenylobacterium hankyongense TaxID=1813876 RepID=A0A328AYJ0_9CAUL|nr:S8 family serine peptidase [Phenylobacterium hankyongense]RAK60192.1 serine protease [Phenylobacterium hankyongense]
MTRARRSPKALASLCVAAAGWLWAGAAWPQARPPADAPQQVLVLLQLAPEHYRPHSAYGAGYGDDLARSARRRQAARIARDHGLVLVSGWPMPLVGLDCYVMGVPKGQSAEAVAARLSREPGIAWSEPMQVFHAQGGAATHNDPLFRAQPAATAWRLADLHQVATGRNVSVAVIDSTVESRHPDLAGQVAIREDFVANGQDEAEEHGTAVAGVIGAKADNGLGIAGVAPGARLMALRACWQVRSAARPDTVCNSLSLAKALHFAIDQQAQVINLSLSGPSDPLLGRLVDVAIGRGAIVVGAFDRTLPRGGFPASHPGVVAVQEESLARPPAGVYVAPGQDIPTTEPGGRWSLVNGSSYAAAHVSGLFALLRERRKSRTGALSLVSTQAGGGAIDACATLTNAATTCGGVRQAAVRVLAPRSR